MFTSDWKTAIAALFIAKQEMLKFEALPRKQYPPNLAADVIEVERLEKYLGCSLPQDYRGFLLHSNGWENFIFGVDLLSIGDIINDTWGQRASELLVDFDELVGAASGVKMNDVVPIAVSKDDTDVFVMVRCSRSDYGTIIWFAPYEIERYDSFTEFFEAIIQYERQSLQDLRDGKFGGSDKN